MITLTHLELEKVKKEGMEVFTQEQYNRFLEANMEVLQKGESNTLDELEKAEYEELKEEIKSFAEALVYSPSKESEFRLEKSIFYIRPKQVEWDESELIKGEDGEEIEKARSGRYTDTPLNRKMGRVGQKYGQKKEEESKPEGKEKESKGTFKVTGLRDGKRVEISGKPLTNEAAKEMMEDAKKSGLYSDIRLGESESSNSTEDKGKPEKKEKRSIKELEDLHPSEMSFKEFERLQGSKGDYHGSDMERSVLKRTYDKKIQEKK